MTGRPSRYTTKQGDAICKRIADGESLRAICKGADMPHRDTVKEWVRKGEEGVVMYAVFSDHYARAREEQADNLFDDMRATAADTAIEVQRAKLMIDTDKWWLARVKPKKYGTDRIEHVGDADAPLTFTVHRVNKPKPEADTDAG